MGSTGRSVSNPSSASHRPCPTSASHDTALYIFPSVSAPLADSVVVESSPTVSIATDHAVGINRGALPTAPSSTSYNDESLTFAGDQTQTANTSHTPPGLGRPSTLKNQDLESGPPGALISQIQHHQYTPGSSQQTSYFGASLSPSLEKSGDATLISPTILPIRELIEERYPAEEPLIDLSEAKEALIAEWAMSTSLQMAAGGDYLGSPLFPTPLDPLPTRNTPKSRRANDHQMGISTEKVKTRKAPMTDPPTHPELHTIQHHDVIGLDYSFHASGESSSPPEQSSVESSETSEPEEIVTYQPYPNNPLSLRGVPERPVENTPDLISQQRIVTSYLRDRVMPEKFIERYTIGDVLGFGGSGFVCVATRTGPQDQGGVEVAVKFIFKDKLSTEDIQPIDGMPLEAYILRHCRHPNIIGFDALYEDEEFYYLVS